MPTVCTTAKELADSVKKHEEEIVIEGDLKNAVFRIKATGKVAWGVCAASLAAAIAMCIATPAITVAATPAGGTASLVSGIAMSTVAAPILGTAVVSAVWIGICAGGIGVLTTLRDKYIIIEKNDRHIKLKRKHSRK